MLQTSLKSSALALPGRSRGGSLPGTGCGDAPLRRLSRRPSRPHCAVGADPSRDAMSAESAAPFAGVRCCSAATALHPALSAACRPDAAADMFCWTDREACNTRVHNIWACCQTLWDNAAVRKQTSIA